MCYYSTRTSSFENPSSKQISPFFTISFMIFLRVNLTKHALGYRGSILLDSTPVSDRSWMRMRACAHTMAKSYVTVHTRKNSTLLININFIKGGWNSDTEKWMVRTNWIDVDTRVMKQWKLYNGWDRSIGVNTKFTVNLTKRTLK